MARGPTFQIREGYSPDVAAANHGADVPNAFGQIARVTASFGAEVQEMAGRAAAQRGAAEAAADVQAGQVRPRSDWTIAGEAYNTVGDRFLVTRQRAAMGEAAAAALAENPDNPLALGKALDAIRAGMKPTGRVGVDAEVAGAWTLQRADLIARATAGAQRAAEAQGRASFVADLQAGQALLDQTASGAPMDAGGAQRVSGAISQLIVSLSRYGPREAFEVAGVKFDADPSRLGALSPADMAQPVAAAVTQARKTWILAQAEKIPDEAGRRMFAAEVQARWQAGDAAFQGLDGADLDQLQRHLEAGADRLRTEGRALRLEAGQRARDAIEAFRWGGDVDFDAVIADATASGDAGLVAQARFYRDADPATRGVLQTVYARQLGLVGGEGPGVELVDPEGNPIAPMAGAGDWTAGQALAAEIRADPAAYFSQILGIPVKVSGKRDPKRNAEVGGSKTSAHLSDLGWDITAPGLTSAQIVAKLRQAGVPFDQLLDEQDHAHFGLGPKMRGQVLVKRGNSWAVPPDVKAGTPAYAAWASAKEGFASDPLNYARGGKSRPAIANVPVLVPDGAFAEGPAAQAWGQALAARARTGAALSRSYGVPSRLLTNGERAYYQSQIEADPQRAVGLAVAARAAAGPAVALQLMRELGATQLEAAAHLHIADLAAGGGAGLLFAKRAAEGLALQGEGARIPDERRREIDEQFDQVRGGVPASVLQAARATALAAATADWKGGTDRGARYYLRGALGASQWDGRVYGGPATLNGAVTVLPRWLAADRADEALETLGALWAQRGVGAYWSNGEPVTPRQMAQARLQPLPNGKYRFIWPKTGNALRTRDGKVIEYDFDGARAALAARLGPSAVRPMGDD